ncbi:MAG: hypothetical protein J0H19_11310 [Rhodospirillales bacterium]|nr:hypothetical protein [Rhodospirillales bacterium]MBN8927197.1 hypothetical protein [Rhodospirillales bacterium]
MRKLLVALVVPLTLGGCFSYTERPAPPPGPAIVLPPGSTVACPNGLAPPC